MAGNAQGEQWYVVGNTISEVTQSRLAMTALQQAIPNLTKSEFQASETATNIETQQTTDFPNDVVKQC